MLLLLVLVLVMVVSGSHPSVAHTTYVNTNHHASHFEYGRAG